MSLAALRETARGRRDAVGGLPGGRPPTRAADLPDAQADAGGQRCGRPRVGDAGVRADHRRELLDLDHDDGGVRLHHCGGHRLQWGPGGAVRAGTGARQPAGARLLPGGGHAAAARRAGPADAGRPAGGVPARIRAGLAGRLPVRVRPLPDPAGDPPDDHRVQPGGGGRPRHCSRRWRCGSGSAGSTWSPC